MKKSKNCALFICSCDKYTDILSPFFTLLKKYWPDLNYDIILSTESTDYEHPDFDIVNIHPDNPDCTWTERIYDALKKIEAKQIIFTLDDFFLYDRVNSKKIFQVVSWLSKNPSIATFTLWNIPSNNLVSEFPGFDQRTKNSNNKVAAIAGIWNKHWLMKYLKNHKENAWQFEIRANKQTRKMLFPGKFYILQESTHTIFPYDFTKYGLYSGLWMKDTKQLFKENKISYNFKSRNWFEEKDFPNLQSIIDAFSLNSYILPCYYLRNRKTSRLYNLTPTSSGPFHQVYHVKNGKNFFKWFASSVHGYSISNLKIKITYTDGTQKPVDNKLLFGQFCKIDKSYVFNTPEPTVFVVTEKEKPYKTVEITGTLNFPATKNQLDKSFGKTTPPQNDYCKQLLSWFWFESLSDKEFRAFVKMEPEISFNSNQVIKEPPRSEGPFVYKYNIPKNTKTATWTPSSTNVGFSIKNLHIKLINSKTSKCFHLKNPSPNPPQPKGLQHWLIFNNIKEFTFNTHEYDKIIITGNFKRGIKPRFLRKTI